MSIFDFLDYKKFVNNWVKSQPKKGHGQFQKIAQVISTSPTIVSLIFKGDRDLTLEQATELSQFLSMTPLETEYFFCLVQFARAGSHKLKKILEQQIDGLRRKSNDLKSRISQDKELSEQASSVFYSHWVYSGLSNLVAIEGLKNIESLSQHLNLPRSKVVQFLEFLVANGVISLNEGVYSPLTARTHLSANSPLISRHHTNWRLKAIEKFDKLDNENEVAYTCPMSLSHSDLAVIRTLILKLIDEVQRVVIPSPSEKAACLNIDWFEF